MSNRPVTNKEKVKLFGEFVKDDNCILMIDGKYFGYDNHPQYPEALFKDIENACIFSNDHSAMDIIKWHPYKTYEIIELNN